MEILTTAIKEGGFGPVQPAKGAPLPEEDILENMRASAEFKVPIQRKQPPNGKTMVFIGGGPSLLNHLDEIAARSEYLVTSNHTHDFLVDKGIIPNACLIMHPTRSMAKAIQKPQKTCTYFLATCTHPDVFRALADYPIVKMLIAYGYEGKADIDLQNELYPNHSGYDFLIGGTMTPLRAMPLACMLGYAKIEYYGVDSSYGPSPKLIYRGEPGFDEIVADLGTHFTDVDTQRDYVIDEPPEGGFYYAYKKKRYEDVLVAEAAGKRFLSCPQFTYQTKQLLRWEEKLQGKLEVEVHGDNLCNHALRAHRAKRARLKLEIGDRRWTDEYARLQERMHVETDYGLLGAKNLELTGRMIIGLYANLRREITLMDYGCGPGLLGEAINNALKVARVHNVDPFHPAWKNLPDPGICDIVSCFDVMEHVEEQCVDNVLKYIAEHCRYSAMFQICLVDASKDLPDGRNAHVTLRTGSWWRQKLENHFVVIEENNSGIYTELVCQTFEAHDLMAAEVLALQEAA